MKSIYEHISELKEAEWNYYEGNRRNKPLKKPFITDIGHRQFTYQYFKKAGKGNISNTDFNADDFTAERASHTCSIFLLGSIIRKNTTLNETLFNETNAPGYQIFPFLWFLTCLSHDFGFRIEKNPTYPESIFDIDTLKKREKIKHDLLKQDINNVPKDIFNLIHKYFIFRRLHFKVIDHGIFAGLKLYDRLVKNRYKQKRKRRNSLFWGDELDTQYALASATVAIHNIWLPAEQDFDLYDKYELNPLIKRDRVVQKEAPLLFLLGIVDTIDPVKTYKRFDPIYVLKNIIIGFERNDTILLSVDKSSDLQFETLHKQAQRLTDWLDLEVVVENQLISISLK